MSNPNPCPSTRFQPGHQKGGRPRGCLSLMDAINRYGAMTLPKLQQAWERRERLPAVERMALRMTLDAATDGADDRRYLHWMDRAAGRPRQAVEVTGANQEPLKIEVVDSRSFLAQVAGK